MDNGFVLPASPTLARLKSEECTVVELQAALVTLIDLFNKQGELFSAELAKKGNRKWTATI